MRDRPLCEAEDQPPEVRMTTVLPDELARLHQGLANFKCAFTVSTCHGRAGDDMLASYISVYRGRHRHEFVQFSFPSVPGSMRAGGQLRFSPSSNDLYDD